MKYTKDDFEIGDKLYVVPIDWRKEPYSVFIEKIGNKYIHGSNTKISLEDFRVEQNFGHRDSVYLSKEAYDKEIEINNLQAKVLSLIPNNENILLQILKIIENATNK